MDNIELQKLRDKILSGISPTMYNGIVSIEWVKKCFAEALYKVPEITEAGP